MHETPGFFAGLDTLDSHLPGREQEPQELGLVGATGQVLIRLAGSCRVAQRSPFHQVQLAAPLPPTSSGVFGTARTARRLRPAAGMISWQDYLNAG